MEKKKTKIISIASIIALALTLVTATFAYFMAQTGEGKSTDIKINASTVDTFTFETGSAISLNLNQDNFASGAGNQSGTTYAKAVLTANNKTNTATEHYYMYLNISENNFIYTQDDTIPEILLSIKDTNENEITSITGLTYKTVTDAMGNVLKGFDITTTSSKTEQWNITITFLNYNFNQSKNAGKNFRGKVLIQTDKVVQTISDVCSDGNNLANCIVSLSESGSTDVTGLYHHDENLENGAGDNSYRFSGADGSCFFNGKSINGVGINNGDFYFNLPSNVSDCRNVFRASLGSLDDLYLDNSITNYVADEKEAVWTGSSCETLDGEIIPFAVSVSTGKFETATESSCVGNSYKITVGEESARAANLNLQSMGAGVWRNINNFVCFGSDANPCPIDNLYRIIGLIDGKVKLVKYDYANSNLLGTDGDYSGIITLNRTNYKDGLNYKGDLSSVNTYYWNYKATGSATNTWSESLLNKTNLNTNFINNIGTTWANKIATTTWKVGGNTYENIIEEVPLVAYTNEITSPAENTIYSAKIGLVYVSDYAFANSQDRWTSMLKSSGSADYNWIYMGIEEWTILRYSSTTIKSFIMNSNGSADIGNIYDGYVVRVSFNLESSVKYVSGDGTQSSPIRIN